MVHFIYKGILFRYIGFNFDLLVIILLKILTKKNVINITSRIKVNILLETF